MNTVEVQIASLPVGGIVEGDIVDPSGNVLLSHGIPLSSDKLNVWTKSGFAKVLIRKFQGLSDYDHALVAKLDQCQQAAAAAVNDMVVSLCMREKANFSAIDNVLKQLAENINQDTDAALQRTRNLSSQQLSKSVRLTNRCVAMATLGAATAVCLGLPPDQCRLVSIAGLLHDVSLFEEPLAELTRGCKSESERQAVFDDHPLNSAQLLESCRGISDQVRVVISQVHEQVDGSGFPRGLASHHLSMPSRILNIVDAYLTLTEKEERALVPADAMCYLVYQATNGTFDVTCLKGLLTAASMYPIGSEVQLSDSTLATVLRSSRTDPLRPIVRRQNGEIFDLRQASIDIVVPHRLESWSRLSRSDMSKILWKPSFVKPVQDG